MTTPRGTASSQNRTRRTLHDFLAFTESGARLVVRGRQAYDSDEMVRLAAEAILHRVGEAVARLDAGFVTAHPNVSWRTMKAMRNLVAHQYGAIDHNIVWNALERDLPREAEEVRRILEND